jgi:hypothetical protein
MTRRIVENEFWIIRCLTNLCWSVKGLLWHVRNRWVNRFDYHIYTKRILTIYMWIDLILWLTWSIIFEWFSTLTRENMKTRCYLCCCDRWKYQSFDCDKKSRRSYSCVWSISVILDRLCQIRINKNEACYSIHYWIQSKCHCNLE